MGFSLNLALRYMRSRKRAFVSVSTVFAVLGVSLGTAALVAVISVTGGFRAEFRDKVLGVNAHVLVLKYVTDFPEYREVMKKVEALPEVVGVNPFVINPMMITHGDRTATGVLVKGVDPERVGTVLHLPGDMVEGSLEGLRTPSTVIPEPPAHPVSGRTTSSLPLAPVRPLLPLDEPLPSPTDNGLSGSGPGEPSFLDVLRELPFEEDSPLPGAQGGKDAPIDTDFDLGPDDLPAGSVVPEGGYESTLPVGDFLPAELDSDPCSEGADELPGIVLGVALKKVLHAELGDCLQVTSPTIGYSFIGGALRPPVAKQFRVIGAFRAGFDQYDSKLAYTDLHEAQVFYQGKDIVIGVEMKLRDIEAASEVTEEVEKVLGGKLYKVIDWEELNHGLFTALRIQQVLMSLVLALIILVATFTVIATLIMIVLDKKKEIAVIKAMGASNAHLLRAFLYQGLIIGTVGTGLGLATGYVVCRWILAVGFPLDPKVYFISQLPVNMRLQDFVLTGIFAVVACLCATAWPALHAARLRPADAFRD